MIWRIGGRRSRGWREKEGRRGGREEGRRGEEKVRLVDWLIGKVKTRLWEVYK